MTTEAFGKSFLGRRSLICEIKHSRVKVMKGSATYEISTQRVTSVPHFANLRSQVRTKIQVCFNLHACKTKQFKMASAMQKKKKFSSEYCCTSSSSTCVAAVKRFLSQHPSLVSGACLSNVNESLAIKLGSQHGISCAFKSGTVRHVWLCLGALLAAL